MVLVEGIIYGVNGLGTIHENGQRAVMHRELVIEAPVVGTHIVLVTVEDILLAQVLQNDISIGINTQPDKERPGKRIGIITAVALKNVVIAFLAIVIVELVPVSM